MSRAGAHAGRLHPEEQFVFAMVFALMAGFVVVVTMAAVRSPVNSLLAGGAAAASSPTVTAGSGGALHQARGTIASSPVVQAASPRLNARLAAGIGPVLGAHRGPVAVGVIDEATGQEALYAPTQRFSSGSIITTDLLAALLIRQEHAGTPVTSAQAVQATAMMKHGSAAAATILWRDIGGRNGLAAANRLLQLSQTTPGTGDQWDQAKTTVADQLQLLIDLTSSRSPLTAAGRAYVLRVIGDLAPTPRWGVSAAGAGTVVQDTWLPAGTLWVANSVGVVRRVGHTLLVVVLSSGNPSRAAGAAATSAVAVAAADVMTSAWR